MEGEDTSKQSASTKETVLMSGTHYFIGSETRRGHGVEGD